MRKWHKNIVLGTVLFAITAVIVLLNHDEEELSSSPVATKKSHLQPINEKPVQETAKTFETLPKSKENVRKIADIGLGSLFNKEFCTPTVTIASGTTDVYDFEILPSTLQGLIP